jgi:hypothetical protein
MFRSVAAEEANSQTGWTRKGGEGKYIQKAWRKTDRNFLLPPEKCFSFFSKTAPHTFISFPFKWKYNRYMLCFDSIVCCGGLIWWNVCTERHDSLPHEEKISSQSYHSVKNSECFTSVSHSL